MSNEIATINFHGDEIIAFKEDNKIYVSVQQVCVAIGVDVATQVKKINDDPMYQAGLKFDHIPELFGNRETPFLEKKYFHKLLNSISTAKVKDGVVRSKLWKYQLECIDAIDEYFSEGFAINEQALQQMPQNIINGIADLIRKELNIEPQAEKNTFQLQQQKLVLARERISTLKEISDVLGDFDKETRETLQQQAIADIYNTSPVQTWTEMDRWYSADLWKIKKEEGWKNAFYDSEQTLVSILGRYATTISKREQYEIIEAPQMLLTGRKVAIHQYQRIALEKAFDKFVEEKKVVQQTKIVALNQ